MNEFVETDPNNEETSPLENGVFGQMKISLVILPVWQSPIRSPRSDAPRQSPVEDILNAGIPFKKGRHGFLKISISELSLSYMTFKKMGPQSHTGVDSV